MPASRTTISPNLSTSSDATAIPAPSLYEEQNERV